MSGVPPTSGGPRGRGRGRARAAEPAQAAPTPGAPPSGLQQYSEVGRRAAIGRRGVDAAQATPTTSDKKQRDSPPTDRSPTGSNSPTELEKMAALEMIGLASRPGYGTMGRKYRMFANHFEISFAQKLLSVQHYQIEISHPFVKLKRDDNRPIFWKCFLDNKDELGLSGPDDLYKVAYDGMHACYTLNALNIHSKNKTFQLETMVSKRDRPTKVDIMIQYCGPIVVDFAQVMNPDLSDRNTAPITVIDILLRQYRSCPYSECSKIFYPFKSSIYMIPGAGNTPGGTDLGGGREIWKGLFTSAHAVEGNRSLVNMDVTHTAFYKFSDNGGNGNGNSEKYSCIQYLCDVLNEAEGGKRYHPSQLNSNSALPPALCSIFEREIRGLRVCLDYKNKRQSGQPTTDTREHRVNGIDRSAVECMFETKEGVKKSVAEYFAEVYGPLKYPKLFTLEVGPKQAKDKPKKRINLPIEHCYLSKNQKVTKKITDNQVALMIRQTCMAPADRKISIEQMVHHARFAEDPFLKNFGVYLQPKMVTVDGRVLPAPSIGYGNNQIVPIRDGVWRASGSKFHIPAAATGIAAVAFNRAPQAANNFVSGLMDCCRQCGMNVPGGDKVFFHLEMNSSPQRVEIAFRNVIEQMRQANIECQLIIVFLPQKGGSLYADVKRVGEIQMGIMTQCVVNKTVDRSSADTLLNIAFKINMKLGGVCCTIKAREQAAHQFFNNPTLVLGIDVTHPGPLEKNKPSVASVVGSMDLTQMRYAASIKVQRTKKEPLVYVIDKVTERLLAFYKSTHHKPTRIIVYRDGVSEGQFSKVLSEELRGIREACLKMDANYRPKITFIVVQKRHHTRLFPENPNDGCGKYKNIYPGTVVDNFITRSEEFVFYLCSHAGIQGTSAPARYNVLHDDNNFSADDIQMISYYLCHCFSRCTRSVSIPAPVYYADLACTRARAHLQSSMGDFLSDTESTLSGEGGSGSSPSEDELIAATTVMDNIRKEMYFT